MNTIKLSLFVLPLTLSAMGVALAQTSAPAPAPVTPPAVAPAPVTPVPSSSSATVPPVAGANSFTEGEARSRIEASGLTNVTDLQKDSQSIWRGKAMKDGKSVSVSLDFQGHVVAE
jgi:protein CpxP